MALIRLLLFVLFVGGAAAATLEGKVIAVASVRLACADDDAQGQSLEVFWEYELDRQILEEEGWQDLAAKGFDALRQFAAFLHTLRWNCVTSTDPKLFQAPFRAGIKIDAYQMAETRVVGDEEVDAGQMERLAQGLHYSTKSFFRQAPQCLTRFQEQEVLADFAFGTLKEGNPQPQFDAWLTLPAEQRDRIGSGVSGDLRAELREGVPRPSSTRHTIGL